MNNEPTKEQLHELIKYENGKLFWKFRDRELFNSDKEFKRWNTRYALTEIAKRPKYFKSSDSYRGYFRFGDKQILKARAVYIMHYGDIPDGLMVDHIDGDTLNDKIENLRAVERIYNANNCKKRKDNKSGRTGVQPDRYDCWKAIGRFQGKYVTLYCGKSYEMAVKAREEWEANHPYMSKRHGK